MNTLEAWLKESHLRVVMEARFSIFRGGRYVVTVQDTVGFTDDHKPIEKFGLGKGKTLEQAAEMAIASWKDKRTSNESNESRAAA